MIDKKWKIDRVALRKILELNEPELFREMYEKTYVKKEPKHINLLSRSLIYTDNLENFKYIYQRLGIRDISKCTINILVNNFCWNMLGFIWRKNEYNLRDCIRESLSRHMLSVDKIVNELF